MHVDALAIADYVNHCICRHCLPATACKQRAGQPIWGRRTHPYSWRAMASAVDVLPVPGGPYNSRCGSCGYACSTAGGGPDRTLGDARNTSSCSQYALTLADSSALLSVLTTSSWCATSLTLRGRLCAWQSWRKCIQIVTGPLAVLIMRNVTAPAPCICMESSTYYFSTQGCMV